MFATGKAGRIGTVDRRMHYKSSMGRPVTLTNIWNPNFATKSRKNTPPAKLKSG